MKIELKAWRSNPLLYAAASFAVQAAGVPQQMRWHDDLFGEGDLYDFLRNVLETI